MPGYRVVLWPDDPYDAENLPDSEVGRKMRKLARSHPAEFQAFDNDMLLVQDATSGKAAFDDRSGLRIISDLGQICGRQQPTLWEVRRPKTRRSGVLRIYFVIKNLGGDTIILLDGEFKDEKSANYRTACSRLKERLV
jgi:hypothetical protein